MPEYTLVNEITYEADDNGEAGVIAAKIVSEQLHDPCVIESQGDFYRAKQETPINTRTLDARRHANSQPEPQ